MADRNLADFNHRVTRLKKAHVNGYGFEASGALGRSHYRERRGLRLPLMGPVLAIMAVLLVLKAAIFVQVGASAYQVKVDGLWQGNVLEQAGAVVMQADPLTLWLADHLGWMR